MRITEKNHSNETHTVVCGLIRPQWIRSDFFNKRNVSLSYILLTVIKTVRKVRLEHRISPQSLIEDEEELIHFPRWIKKYAINHIIIDTTSLSLSQVASIIVNRILSSV
jgi:hypothetical protein